MTEPTPKIHAEPSMQSAGAELMGLSHRMSQHPEFAADADRVREIGVWASMDRMTDMERMLIPMFGSMMDAMRRRNYEFSEDLPIGSQFSHFMDTIPEPVPGEIGFVDQNTVAPIDRRDTFEASVAMSDVRTWTSADGVLRGLARKCVVTPPEGVPDESMVYAEGDLVALLEDGVTKTLTLRSGGSALKVQVAQSMPIETVRTLRRGDVVTLLEQTMGESADNVERIYPIGTTGQVTAVETLKMPQGLSVTVVIGPQDGDEAIVNVFDEGDPSYPLRLVHRAKTDDAPTTEAFVRLCETLGIPATAAAYLEVPRILRAAANSGGINWLRLSFVTGFEQALHDASMTADEFYDEWVHAGYPGPVKDAATDRTTASDASS